MNRFELVVGLVLVTLATFGCQRSTSYPSARLAGDVTIDGSPIDEGNVTFLPSAGQRGPIVGAKIVRGRYDCLNVPLGKVHVTISAARRTGKEIEMFGTKVPEFADIIPEAHRNGEEIEVIGDNLKQNFVLHGIAGTP